MGEKRWKKGVSLEAFYVKTTENAHVYPVWSLTKDFWFTKTNERKINEDLKLHFGHRKTGSKRIQIGAI